MKKSIVMISKDICLVLHVAQQERRIFFYRTTPVKSCLILVYVLETERGFSMNQRASQQRPPISTPDDKEISTIAPANFPTLPSHHGGHHMNNNGGVWSWLSRKSTASPTQLNTPPSLPAENHYTHMEDGKIISRLIKLISTLEVYMEKMLDFLITQGRLCLNFCLGQSDMSV